jgi:hypothetical protein
MPKIQLSYGIRESTSDGVLTSHLRRVSCNCRFICPRIPLSYEQVELLLVRLYLDPNLPLAGGVTCPRWYGDRSGGVRGVGGRPRSAWAFARWMAVAFKEATALYIRVFFVRESAALFLSPSVTILTLQQRHSECLSSHSRMQSL